MLTTCSRIENDRNTPYCQPDARTNPDQDLGPNLDPDPDQDLDLDGDADLDPRLDVVPVVLLHAFCGAFTQSERNGNHFPLYGVEFVKVRLLRRPSCALELEHAIHSPSD